MSDIISRLRAMPSSFNDALRTMDDAAARIEALEAALRTCVQYHVKAAADCHAIAAVNQDNALGRDCLTHAIDHAIAAEDIDRIARTALDKDTGK